MPIKNFLKKFHSKFYVKIFTPYPIELQNLLLDCNSILDVGCGSNSPIQFFSKNMYSVGIDVFAPSIEESKNKGIHNKYYKMGVLDIGSKFSDNSFDCVLASDLIEHLEKKEGLKLIKLMEKIAKKKIIIFTPNGYLPQGECENNPYQEHKSGWTYLEMQKKGLM